MPKITVQASLPVTLETWQTPNFALHQPPKKKNERGYDEGDEPEKIAVPLHQLDTATLEMLCAEFRKEVFRKAGKPCPQLVEAHKTITDARRPNQVTPL